jgi:hypothetical protein
VSLSQEPALSTLKNYMVCGYKDISGEPYAGMSGRHDRDGNAVQTTNGAGPHNIQMFIMSGDGTVLTCLPGYWAPQDLVYEVQFANQLNKVWTDPHLSRAQKDQTFTQLHLAHSEQHPRGMVSRSHLQGFDAMFEAQKLNSDAIKNPTMLASYESWGPNANGHFPMQAFKTTDVLMHERMAKRPFVAYNRFDVAAYSDYGKWQYDKEEDARMADGSVNHDKLKEIGTIGDQQSSNMHNTQVQQPKTTNWGSRSWGSQ